MQEKLKAMIGVWLLEDDRHSLQDYHNAVEAVTNFRSHKDDKNVYIEGIGKGVIYLRDSKYKYRFYTKTRVMYGVKRDIFEKAVDTLKPVYFEQLKSRGN